MVNYPLQPQPLFPQHNHTISNGIKQLQPLLQPQESFILQPPQLLPQPPQHINNKIIQMQLQLLPPSEQLFII